MSILVDFKDVSEDITGKEDDRESGEGKIRAFWSLVGSDKNLKDLLSVVILFLAVVVVLSPPQVPLGISRLYYAALIPPSPPP